MARSGCRYLKQALLLYEGVGIYGPKVDVRLSTGDDQVVIHGMKHSSQHGIIGALQTRQAWRETAPFLCGLTQIWTMALLGTLTSASCFSFCQFQTDRM